MNSVGTCKTIDDIAMALLSSGHAINATLHTSVSLGEPYYVRVTWPNNQFTLTDYVAASYDEYLALLRERQFSVILNDGAILQISYDFRRDTVEAHRLAFIPCPIEFTQDELDDLTIEDFLAVLGEEEIQSRLRSRPYLRFDYNRRAPETEPFSHLQTCYSESRIPVCGPLLVQQFTGFIFKNFYPGIARDLPLLTALTEEPLAHNIRDEQRSELHFHFHRVVRSLQGQAI